MDIINIRTFLAVLETGSFVAAAERVHVTQSTVSMRIRSLEDQLGVKVFARNKSGASLTNSGREFTKHAMSLARIWDQACLEVGVGNNKAALLRVGGQLSIWGSFLVAWLAWMRVEAPTVSIKCEVGYIDDLMRNLTEGSLDIAVMYRPQQRTGLQVRKLFDDDMILVASPAAADPMMGDDYVFVNWGPEFRSDHALNYPDINRPHMSLDLGVLGIDYLVRAKAAGYFPRRVCTPYLQSGILRKVQDAVVFTYPVYAVHTDDLDDAVLKDAFLGLDATIAQYQFDGMII
jgi:DNA-binding transcriptional LysR family regulator